jgi:hypothetical protein
MGARRMKPSIKLPLDILMGAVIPILVLNNLTRPLGAPVAYVLAALVPVAWVAVDLLFITRRFNYITSYIGLSAIINGLLAFWFVDGLLFALKDSVGLLVSALAFGGSLLVGKPLLAAFFGQGLNADTPDRLAALADLLAERGVRRGVAVGTAIVVLTNLLLAAINFWLNLTIVVAPFGVEAFNSQVAQVNAITRVAFPIPSILSIGLAIFLVYRVVYRSLPSEGEKPQLESDFWTLMALREARSPARRGPEAPSAPA